MPPRPKIDAGKLRRLLMQRKRGFDESRALTDQYLEVRDKIAQLESHIRALEVSNQQPHPSEAQRLTDYKAEAEEISRARAAASARINRYAFVSQLVDYARRCGYTVDPSTCSVMSPPVRDSRGPAPSGPVQGISTYGLPNRTRS